MELYKREKYLKKIRPFYHTDDIIKVITGVRRCGKSSLMHTVANELLEKGVDEKNIIFIDLDTRKYKDITTSSELENIIDSLLIQTGMNYLFIDEIQNVEGFEEVVNAYRTEGNVSIFITGSNSYMLSGELVTKLTGRYLEFEIYTLCFDEYINMKKFFGKKVDSNSMVELNNYIIEGGFPRTVLLDGLEVKRTYVEGVVREIFDKDIIKRIKVKDQLAFEAVRNYIINNFGSTTSIRNLYENLKKKGIKIGRNTVDKYIKALVDSKILYKCDRFDMKSRRSIAGEKKYYIADLIIYYKIEMA